MCAYPKFTIDPMLSSCPDLSLLVSRDPHEIVLWFPEMVENPIDWRLIELPTRDLKASLSLGRTTWLMFTGFPNDDRTIFLDRGKISGL